MCIHSIFPLDYFFIPKFKLQLVFFDQMNDVKLSTYELNEAKARYTDP